MEIDPVDFPNPRALHVKTTNPRACSAFASTITESLLPPKPCASSTAGAGFLTGRYIWLSILTGVESLADVGPPKIVSDATVVLAVAGRLATEKRVSTRAKRRVIRARMALTLSAP